MAYHGVTQGQVDEAKFLLEQAKNVDPKVVFFYQCSVIELTNQLAQTRDKGLKRYKPRIYRRYGA